MSFEHYYEFSCSSPIKEHPEEEVPSPAPPPPPQVRADQVIWKGFVNMNALAKFATTAYPVSGPVENLDEVKGGQ